jgi:hypothetical protein
MEAARLHLQLHRRDRMAETGGAVDVFDASLQLNLPLILRPLNALLGAYLPLPTPGILITTQRPLSIQRFTTAHELGHFRLQHLPAGLRGGGYPGSFVVPCPRNISPIRCAGCLGFEANIRQYDLKTLLPAPNRLMRNIEPNNDTAKAYCKHMAECPCHSQALLGQRLEPTSIN